MTKILFILTMCMGNVLLFGTVWQDLTDLNRRQRKMAYEAWCSYAHDIAPKSVPCSPYFAQGEERKKLKEEKCATQRVQNIAFEDMKGLPPSVFEYVADLRRLEEYDKHGVAYPAGLLLYGPPGTGKTALARAIAAYVGFSFVSVSGSEFADKYVGESSRKIRELFQRVRASRQETILFIDEIDAIGAEPERGANQEYRVALNALLVELGALQETKSPLFVIGATNRFSVLSKALIRDGRFNIKIELPLPNDDTRKEILMLYAQKHQLQLPVDQCDQLAKRTKGSSGAELSSMVTNAVRFAIRQGEGISLDHVRRSVDVFLQHKKEAARREALENREFFFEVTEPDHGRLKDSFAGDVPLAIADILMQLQSPERYEQVQEHGFQPLLFEGPPGTGKTLLARCLAAQAHAKFISLDSGALIQKYVGDSSKFVHELFQCARDLEGNVVLFLDELDAIARNRDQDIGQEYQSAQNALLIELSDPRNRSLLVIGATNKLDMLDPAMIRPERFGTIVNMGLPDDKNREIILRFYFNKKRCQLPGNTLEDIVCNTKDFSGADLGELVRQAARAAAREDKNVLSRDHMYQALAIVKEMIKRQKERTKTDREFHRDTAQEQLWYSRIGVAANVVPAAFKALKYAALLL